MTDMAATTIRLSTTRTIKAPAKAIYQAWLDPKKMPLFFGSCQGDEAQDIEVDPRPGGAFTIPMPTPGGKVLHSGEYLALEPYVRIVFTWNSKHVNPGSVVTVTLREVEGGTELTLLHEKFASESMRDGHLAGWGSILDKLVAVYA